MDFRLFMNAPAIIILYLFRFINYLTALYAKFHRIFIFRNHVSQKKENRNSLYKFKPCRPFAPARL